MKDRFDELDEIGHGGMSTIMRAFDRLLERNTAQKVLKARFTASPRHIDRFTAEARMTGQLEHPNIVPVHAFGETSEGEWFINMKLVEGDTLEHLVESAGEGRLDRDQLAHYVQILLKVLDALSFAHSRGVVHRDMKPANVMVGPFGEVYLMDWGVARRVDDGSSLDDLTGTPAFMAPEQVSGEGVDQRTDVFAVGATLYFCIAGKPPYPGPTAIQALQQAMEGSWPRLNTVLGDRVPPGIEAILERAMQVDPARRYPTARSLKADLEAWLRGRWHLPSRTYSPGSVIVREGDDGDEAFVIVSGACEASTEVAGERTTLSRMGPGDVFGEMAIFGQRPRTSTVTALTELEVQVVTRATLAAGTGLDSWVGKFITVLTERFVQAETRLYQSEERVKTKVESEDSDGSKA